MSGISISIPLILIFSFLTLFWTINSSFFCLSSFLTTSFVFCYLDEGLDGYMDAGEQVIGCPPAGEDYCQQMCDTLDGNWFCGADLTM